MPDEKQNSVSEFETIEIYNPLKEDFKVRFNGQLYTIEKETRKAYPRFLAFHIAKHLSDKLLTPEAEKRIKKQKEGDVFNPAIAQLMIYDNPIRRITLFSILKNETMVQECIMAFPFKGFIGDMDEYDEYVAESKATKKTVEAPSTVVE